VCTGLVVFQVKSLTIGDVTCSYEDGSAWVAERKTADDIAKSIIDGRWAEQTSRLMSSGYSYVFFIVEGDLAASTLPHTTLLGACVNAELRAGSHFFRTACVEETALVIQQLVNKCTTPPGIPSGIQPKSKRVRDSETVWIRQLMCIPSISEHIARQLLGHFGSLRSLQDALADLDSFPRIRLNARTCIGKIRIQMLAIYLT
jgi:ERCC4-type nuclease